MKPSSEKRSLKLYGKLRAKSVRYEVKSRSDFHIRILDITANGRYERYLYKCLSPFPFRKYRKRRKYLESAIPRGFHKELLILNRGIVGQIEYGPPEASGYPILGEDIIVMNCIWVLRKAAGHNLGKQLLADMMEREKHAVGFATIALENHWSPWLRKEQMEKLGFKSVTSVKVMHKTKRRGHRFRIHLMWLPTSKDVKAPGWSEAKLLEGVDFCLAHPLYHPEKPKLEEVLEKC